MGKKVWLSTKEAGVLLGCSDKRVIQLIKQGTIDRKDWRMRSNAYQIHGPNAATTCAARLKTEHRAKGHAGPPGVVVKHNNRVISPQTGGPERESQPVNPLNDAVTKYGYGSLTYQQAAEEKARQQLAGLKMKNDEGAGKLVDKAEVEADAFRTARLVRDAILNVPARISAELASLTDTHSVDNILTTELTKALEGLSDAAGAP